MINLVHQMQAKMMHELFHRESSKIATAMISHRICDASDIESEILSHFLLLSRLGKVFREIFQLSGGLSLYIQP